MSYDVIVVGAGFAGAVAAERLAHVQGKRVLVLEKRGHVGGNAYDRYDQQGILIHQYGPHIFHTKLAEVWDYLSQFTNWRPYEHRVLGEIEGQLVPIPFNLTSIERLFDEDKATQVKQLLIERFGMETKVPILKLQETDHPLLAELAEYIYRHVFLGYTLKQWGMRPEELDPYVTGRVPVHISYDDRYFQDRYQAMPVDGYTKLFERMLEHSRIEVQYGDAFERLRIDVEARQIFFDGERFDGRVIYTGKIDELLGYRFGALPYRSLDFVFESEDREWVQSTGTVNYPNAHDYTRITEFKHLTGQVHPHSTITKEYPGAYDAADERFSVPYYPVPKPENHDLYKQYARSIADWDQVTLIGRLAEYKYYDMDAVVAKVLHVVEKFKSAEKGG